MKVWFRITEKERKELAAFQEEHHPYIRLQPPKEDKRYITFDFKLESPGEIGKIMRKRPKYPRRVAG